MLLPTEVRLVLGVRKYIEQKKETALLELKLIAYFTAWFGMVSFRGQISLSHTSELAYTAVIHRGHRTVHATFN